MTSRELVRITL